MQVGIALVREPMGVGEVGMGGGVVVRMVVVGMLSDMLRMVCLLESEVGFAADEVLEEWFMMLG